MCLLATAALSPLMGSSPATAARDEADASRDRAAALQDRAGSTAPVGRKTGKREKRSHRHDGHHDGHRDGKRSKIRDSKHGDRRRDEPSLGERIVAVAGSKAGTPYAWGASGPGAFDCSGFTAWVFARFGEALPHSSAGQVARTVRVASPTVGDLVFFTGSGGVYHVGIYAGSVGGERYLWHAPRPGEGVQRSRIWTSSVFYGRVR